MKYLAVKKDLFLVEQEVPKKTNVVTVQEAVNHIWIYDRSYSMSDKLRQLALKKPVLGGKH